MKKIVFLIVAIMGQTALWAQDMEQEGEHAMPFNKPDEAVANAIVWVSVVVVAITLILTLKYLIKPGEDNPDHIKNIVTHEGI